MPQDDPLRPLIEAAVGGDEAALAEFVQRTRPAVWKLCAALGSPGEQADLVQDVYLRALRALPTFRGEAPALVWLLSITRRVCADDVRRRQRQRRLVDRLVTWGVEETTDQPAPVENLVRELQPDRRAAFVLTQLIGLSYDEAAMALDCPVGTIRSRVSRARSDLIAAVRRAEGPGSESEPRPSP